MTPDAAARTYTTFVMHWIGTLLLGSNVLNVFTPSTLKYLQIFWVVLTVATLLANYSKFFGESEAG